MRSKKRKGSDDDTLFDMDKVVHPASTNGNGNAQDSAFDVSGYQIVRREFISHFNEPAITFNDLRIAVNAACLKRFSHVDHVQLLINPVDKVLAIRPCKEEEKDAFVWASGGEKRHPRQIVCRVFYAKVFDLMGWHSEYRYKLLGNVVSGNNEQLLVFDLSAPNVYRRVGASEKANLSAVPMFLEGWRNQFGLSVSEHRERVLVKTFQDYIVFGVNGGDDVEPPSISEHEFDDGTDEP